MQIYEFILMTRIGYNANILIKYKILKMPKIYATKTLKSLNPHTKIYNFIFTLFILEFWCVGKSHKIF